LGEEDSERRSSQFAYLDLLTTALTEHEKNLNRLIEKLEKISNNLAKIAETSVSPAKPPLKVVSEREATPETLIYIRLKVRRSPEELKAILKSLKE